MTFKPFIARARCCDSLLMLFRPRQYTECQCGKTSVDAGDGGYWRMNVVDSAPLPLIYSQEDRGRPIMTRKGEVEE
jgi:hypothetical protein